MQGQAKRVSYRNQNHYVAPLPLESLSTDLCGPVTPKTIHGEKYTSVFIDHASRFIFGRLLKTKDEVVIHLDELTSELDNQRRDSRISNVHSDDGGEYTSSNFRAACYARGIRQKFTNAHTPEENHLAEKTNEYLFNKVTSFTCTTTRHKSCSINEHHLKFCTPRLADSICSRDSVVSLTCSYRRRKDRQS